MKNLRQKKIFVVLISVLVLCLIAGAITMLVLHQREEALEEQQNEALQELYDNEGRYDPRSIVLSNTTKPRAENLAEAFGAELRITEDGCFAALTLPEGVTVFDVYENDEYRKYLEYMSLDYQAKISDLLPSDETEDEASDERLPMRPQYTVNDTDYNRQTYLDYLNMSNVWSKTKGSGITVAVIDTGIDTDHPEFAGRISEYSYNATEDKIVKDYVLSDGSLDWSLVEDEQGHGTAVTGVIAASMDGNGVVGIAPQVNIIVIKAECDEYGNFERTSDLVFGLYYAIERDVAVVNMSFGVVSPEDPFAEPAQLAFDSDVICVAAAGNKATANLTWPAAGENVFGVGALAQDSWELATYSNYGENVDFVAPGTVYTTKMGGGYGGTNGTSFASPVTAGVLALYMSQNKYAEFNTVEELIYASCYDLGDLGPDWYYGYGALDVSALMLEERGTVTFNMMTDELDNTEQVFIRTHTLQNMPEPERLYAIFDGWYYDPQCTDEYMWYEDEFHSDLTLYANWVNEDDGIPYTYVELDDGTIEIRSYTGHRRYITIPDYIDGKVVSSIGEFAFKGETRLREVKLPKYLKRIRMGAFSGCSNLVTMEIPDTVTEIGANAFYDNVRLSTLIFGEDSQLISIGDFAFSGCAKMRTFTVPSKVTALNATAFLRNTAMMAFDVQKGNTAFSAKEGVLFNYTGSALVCYPAGLSGTYTVPENVRTVGDYAFACTRLSGVELSRVQTLGKYAFVAGSLESIVIPDSVTSMGGSVFAYNGYLRSAEIGAGLTSVSEEAFMCTALESIEIPAGIQSIGGFAFASIGSLVAVTFEEESTLVYIGSGAFFDSGVVSVDIPASVVTIDNMAFGICPYCKPKLSFVTFEENSSLHTIGASAYERQSLLKSVDLPDRLSHLGDYAFMETGLITVDIPASVTYLGAGAFASCHSLENIFVEEENKNYVDVDGVVYDTAKKMLVAYPAGNARKSYKILNGVTDIGAASFYGSWNLTSVDLSSTVTTVREKAFYDCENVTKYDMSNVLTYIQASAFSRNYRLQSMSMPDSLVQISNNAFAEDWNLRSVTFTENAKLPRISYGAFAYCGLTSFRVPSNVSTMAQGAFMGCSNLQSFTFAKNSKLESISAYMLDGCSNLRTITFEKGSALTSIQAHGLEGMRKLTKIDFGDAKLTNIDDFAFRFCESLTCFDIPEGVTFLGRYAFYYCTNLSEVTVPSTMDFIGRFAFLGTKDLDVYFASETLPANLAEDWDHGTKGYYLGVTDVVTEGDWTYAKLTGGDIAIIKYNGTATEFDLTTLNLGGDIVNIGGSAFADSTLENIVLPETLQIIQAEAFCHSELKSVSLPASVTFIGREAFAYTPIESLTFAPDSNVKTMEQSAFEKTEELGSVVIPASVTTMGRAVFKSSGITSLSFADGFSMTEISEEAFAYTHISAVTIPDSVTVINHNAFREIKELKSVTFGSGDELMIMSNVFYQSGLETVYIPENVGYVGEYAFIGLHNLTEFAVSENNPYYKAVDGLLISKNGRKLVSVPAGKTGSLTVPEGIEVIGFGAFEDSKLSEIKFLDDANILSFGYRAFYNADGITEMHIPASVVAIDYYAFAMCDNLQTVTFAEDNNLNGVYEGAFYGCKSLSEIMLPDSIVEISDFAFYGCRKLTDVPVSETSTVKGIYDYAFAYAGFSGDFTTPETLIDIGPYAFMGNKFTSVTVPDANYWDLVIGIGAFEDCQELTEITVPFIGASFEDDGITWFGYIFGAGRYEANATYVPQSLKRINIGEGISFVGRNAFWGLAGLERMKIPHSVQIVYEGSFVGTTATYTLTNTITILYESGERHFGKGFSGHLELAHGVTSIASNEFAMCSGLTSITIPETITRIGNGAFVNCENLCIIYNNSNLELEIGSSANGRIASYAKLIIDKAGNKIYRDETSGFEYVDTIDHFRFIKENGSYQLIAYLGEDERAILPQDINGKTYEIKSLIGIRNLIIPDGITIIDDAAFQNCSDLKSITIPDSVIYIGEKAFYNCHSLTSITIPNSVTSIGNMAFYGCENLTSIMLPTGVTNIGFSTFYGCKQLKSISIPDGVTHIGYRAFYGCMNLKSITIPDSVTNIGVAAFYNCSSLKSISIPDNVTYLETQLFYGCSSLMSVFIPTKARMGAEVFYGCSSLTSIEIPDGVTSIGYQVFYGCSSLTSITIPDGVTSIGDYAFYDCSSLTSIEIPNSVRSLGTSAFVGCPLPQLNVSSGNMHFTEVGGCLYDKNVTKLLYVPNSITELYIPNTVTKLSLANNKTVQIVTFEENSALKKIDSCSFSGCSNLRSIELPDSVTAIDSCAFSDCSKLVSISIPNGVTRIGSSAFINCISLTSIKIPDEVTQIDISLFQGCSSLTSIELPEGITTVEKDAFRECSRLTSITLPSSLTSIGSKAFYGCRRLYLVNNNSSIILDIDSSTDSHITAYAKLIIDKEGTRTYKDENSGFEYIDTDDGFRFLRENGKYTLIAYLGSEETVTLPRDVNGNPYVIYRMSGVQKVVIPDGVTCIDDSAFESCNSLMSITISDTVVKIGDNAFFDCINLADVEIPKCVTSIGYCAFGSCSSLKRITIPDGVTSIEGYVFWRCSSLTSITIPETVTSIGESAFSECINLTYITISENVTSIGGDAFGSTSYYNTPSNWTDGCLYLNNYVIAVDKTATYILGRDNIFAFDSLNRAYGLQKMAFGGNHKYFLKNLTNLETLILTEIPTKHLIFEYSLPSTLKSIVLDKDVRMRSNAFKYTTGITIYVEANEKDVHWDENFPGWNYGNKVVYGDDWITADFYDQNGTLVSSEIFLTHQIIRQPYLELAEGLEESEVLVGWDINGDGVADTIPATSTVDIVAYPVIETRASEYTVSFYDADGKTLISKVILPYGAEIVAPVIEEKMGYTTSGWVGYTEGMTVSGNHVFVLDRVHNGGGHDYGEPVWVAPTCTEGGYNKHICKICGEWYATDHVEPLGHDYAVTEKPATCTEEGEITRTCRNCGDSHTEWIQPKGHSYHGTLQKEATCTKQGEMLYTCENCGNRIIEKTPMAAHDYQKKTASKWWLQIMVEKIMNIFFGYEGDDVFYYECTKCKRIQTAEESKTGNGVAGVQSAGCAHQLGEWVEYIAPTCEGDGVDAKFCSLCEKAVEFRRGANAIGHDHDSVVTDPTCTEKGYTTHTCHCGDTYVDSYVNALGHDAVQHSAKDATCTESGWSAYDTCNRCDYTSYVEIPAKGHDHKTVVTTPTCTEKGYTTHTCHCGDTYVDSYVNALGHAKVQHSAKAPTCTEVGWQTYEICSRCDYTTYEEIPAKGHDHKAVVTAPNCTEKGYTTHTCHCGDTYVDSYVDALGHDAVQHSAKDATCTEIGWSAYDTCNRCDYTSYVEIPAQGHDHKTVVTAPTCTEKGYTTHTCHCGDIYVDSYVDALGHDAVQHSAKDATCTEIGWKAYETCSRCDYTTYVEIPAKGHTTSDWVIDTEPAPGVEGSRHKECTECGETLETGVIEALPVETEAPTEAPTASNPNGSDTDPSGKGCSGVVLANSVGVILLAALCSVIAVRRREDEDC